MIKKIICLSLALLFVLCALIGCKKENSEAPSGDTVSTEGAEEKKELERLKDVNYGGKRITIHVRGDEDAISEIGMESYGDMLSEALFARTCATEERIGVDIQISEHEGYQKYNNAITALRTTITSQEGSYDIVAGWSCRIISLAVEGLFHDLNSTAYYSSEDEWWSRSITNSLTVGGKIYLNTGDIAATYMDSCYAIAVNQAVSENFGYKYDSFYDIVDSGDWTLDYFNQLVKDAYDDDGDFIRDDGDKFGLVAVYSTADAFWTSCDLNIISNNGSERPVMSFNTEKIQGVVDKVHSLFYGNDGAVIDKDDGMCILSEPIEHFQRDLAMFTILRLGDLAQLSSMDTAYGVLPMPKYDKEQENYRTYVQQSMSLWCIPIDAVDKDMSSAVMTSMGFDSKEMVIETHYETVLKVRYVKDSTSGYMIDLIYNGIYMNFDTIFNESLAESVSRPYRVNMPVYLLRNMESDLQQGKPNVQAWWVSNQSGVEARLNGILDGFFEVNG